MTVDPSDSSYTPSLIVVNGGDSFTAMNELSTINIRNSDTVVVLLSDLKEVFQISYKNSNILWLIKKLKFKIVYWVEYSHCGIPTEKPHWYLYMAPVCWCEGIPNWLALVCLSDEDKSHHTWKVRAMSQTDKMYKLININTRLPSNNILMRAPC